MRRNLKPSRINGFTLIEILITLVIMAFGLLGLAAMQVVAMKNNHSAYLRTQATTLASEYGDILRNNAAQLKQNKFGTSAADGHELNSILNKLNGTALSATATCFSSGCTASQLAETQIYNWLQTVRNTLPSSIVFSNRTGNIYTLQIIWLDDRKDDDGTAGVDINADGDTLDSVDSDNDGNVDGKETQYKVFITRFQV